MTPLGPRTILQLVLAGFCVVALPLVAALVTALVEMDDLSRQSRYAVFQAARSMQAGRELVQQVTEMERNAQQYAVLGDRDLYNVYLARRGEFLKSVRELARLDLGDSVQKLLERLVRNERELYRKLGDMPTGAEYGDDTAEGFRQLSATARSVLLESSRLITREADSLQRAAVGTQRTLLWQAAALIPAALLLAALFTWIIARPLRQMDRAIRQLGSGEFERAITVRGPRDLEELGQRLDWLRRRLRELEAQKVSFLRHMSHELKTPLTAIREGADLLTERVAGRLNEEQAEIARILGENSVRLQKLIEDLLKFSVARPPEIDGRGRPVELQGLIEAVLEDHKLAISARGLNVEKSVEAVSVQGDREQLRAVLDNLLSNAVKYSPPSGALRIALSASDGRAVLDLEDAGPGIDAEDRERVFEAFYQGGTPASGQVEGTGLGLAIAREYARLHHGDIEIVAAERGTHMRVTLPLSGEQSA